MINLTLTPGTTNFRYDQKHPDRALPRPYRLSSSPKDTNVIKAGLIAFPQLYAGGLWMELKHPGPMQAYQAVIYNEGGKVKVQRQFVITRGSNTFFWKFDNTHWPGGMYTLLLRDKFRRYEWKLLL